MIVLTFNPSSLEDFKNDISIIRDDAAVIFVTGFELPVMFQVNNINLFEIAQEQVVMVSNLENQSIEPTTKVVTSSWITMPILNFAINGMEAAEKINQGEAVNLELPETGVLLQFRVVSNKVEIYSGVNKKTVTTDSSELLTTFENFLAQVRDALRNKVPQLLDHPYWGSWLKNG